MAKISHGADTWRSEGLAKKYKELDKIAFDKPVKYKSKKNTKKWCKGKSGVEHQFERYFWHYGWESIRTRWIRTRCKICHKEVHGKNLHIPLKIEIDEDNSSKIYPIQVKANGKAIPINYKEFYKDKYCLICNEWHSI